MLRLFAFVYELIVYAVFITVFLWLIAFVGKFGNFDDFAMPKTITCKVDVTMVHSPEKRCTVW